MPSQTLKRRYRYPTPGDAPDVPGWIQKGMEDVDADVDALVARVASLEAPRPVATFTGRTGVQTGALWGTGALTKVGAKSVSDSAIVSTANDNITLPPSTRAWNVHYRARLTDNQATPANKPTTGQTYMNIRNLANNEAEEYDSYDFATGTIYGSVRLSGLYLPDGGTLKFRFYTATASVWLESVIRVSQEA